MGNSSVLSRLGRITAVLALVALAGAALPGGLTPAWANLTVIPTYDFTITSDPNAATIVAGIQAAINQVQSYIANPVTVNITFQEIGNPFLGGSLTNFDLSKYSDYVSALNTNQTKSTNDNIAIASLPANPSAVNGNGASTVKLSNPLLRALSLGGTGGPTDDGSIFLNTSIMNLSRSGLPNPFFYDLQSVAMHEISEVLGSGGTGSLLPSTTSIGTLDLYRYTASGVRSYSTATNIAPYFSIDGGKTKFVNFNQFGGGSDYSDWGTGEIPPVGHGNSPPQVQDAFGTPGSHPDLGPNELAALDVMGWDLTLAGLALEAKVPQAPVPPSLGLLALGLLGLLSRAAVQQRHRASTGKDN